MTSVLFLYVYFFAKIRNSNIRHIPKHVINNENEKLPESLCVVCEIVSDTLANKSDFDSSSGCSMCLSKNAPIR